MLRVKVIIRSLCRNPGLSLSAVIALALGIGANTALFTVVSSLVLHPYPLPQANRLVAILEREPNDSWSRVAPADYFDLTSQSTSFSTLADVGATDQIWSIAVSDHLLGLLDTTPMLGRSLQAGDYMPSAPRTALLSHREWLSRFAGNTAVLGHTVLIDDQPYTIVGVMPKGFILPGYRRSDIFLPLRPDQADRTDRTNRNLYVCGLLKRGVSLQQASAALQGISQRMRVQWPREVQGRKIYASSFREYLSQESRPALLALLGVSMFVLLSAAANVAALLLARTVVRRHEIAIRRALGASSAEIAAHSLIESLIIALLGGIAGVAVAMAGVPLLLRLIPTNMPVAGLDNVHLNVSVFAFALALTAVLAIALGLVPALSASKSELNDVLHEGGRSATLGRGGRRLLRSLTAMEVALALVLAVCAGLMISSLKRLLTADRGFEPEHVLTVEVPTMGQRFKEEARQKRLYADMIRRINLVPGVRSVGFVNVLPLSGADMTTQISIEGRTERSPVELLTYAVSAGYFRAIRIRLLEGRFFNDRDGSRNSPQSVIVDQAFARRYWPGESAIGKRVRQAGGENPWQIIVGMVGDIRHASLREAARPALYYDYQRYIGPTFVATLAVRATADPVKLVRAVRQAVIDTDPALPISKVAPMVQVMDESVWQNRLSTAILSIFAALALVLGAIGIYGTLSYVVQQSLRDAGIRLALGATPARILCSTLGGAIRPALVGVLLGILGAVGLTRFIGSYLYGVTATDPKTFAISALTLLAVALFASIIPARRASIVEPSTVLRHE